MPYMRQSARRRTGSARISLRPSLKTNPDSFRVRNTDDLKQTLAKDYLDHRTGISNAKIYDAILPFADMIVNIPLWTGNEGVGGRSHSYEDSELTAILEGFERYSGIEPRGKRTIVHDTYENVKIVRSTRQKSGSIKPNNTCIPIFLLAISSGPSASLGMGLFIFAETADSRS